MNNHNAQHAVAAHAVLRNTSLCVMLLAFSGVAPSTAQQPDLNSGPAVPDNVAPHTAPAQPIPFSHMTHMTLGLQCQGCHTNPDPGSMMTFPETATCMACHLTVSTNTPAIDTLYAFSESGNKIPWVRVYTVTKGVNWSHRAHLDSGAQCETCHGDVGQTEAVSETKAILAMASCIRCHEARAAKTECVTCHAWPTDQLLGIR